MKENNVYEHRFWRQISLWHPSMGAIPQTRMYLLTKDVRIEFDKEYSVIGITGMGTDEYNKLVEKFQSDYDRFLISDEELSATHLFIKIKTQQ